MRPVLEARLQRALDQQRAKTGAVDEQVPLDLLPRLQRHRRHVAIALAQHDIDDPPFEAPHAPLFADAPQVPGIQAGVEVERVRNLRQR